MKKLLKIASILAVVAMLLISLTGCGGNKIVGTMKDDDGKAKVVATFDSKDRLKEMTFTYEFKDKDDAEDAYDSMKDMFEDVGKIKKSGKKITIKIKGKDLAEESNMDYDDVDKDYITDAIEGMGFEIKD